MNAVNIDFAAPAIFKVSTQSWIAYVLENDLHILKEYVNFGRYYFYFCGLILNVNFLQYVFLGNNFILLKMYIFFLQVF